MRLLVLALFSIYGLQLHAVEFLKGDSDKSFSGLYGGFGLGISSGQSTFTAHRPDGFVALGTGTTSNFSGDIHAKGGDLFDVGFTDADLEGRVFIGFRDFLPANKSRFRLGLEGYYQFTDDLSAPRFRVGRIDADRSRREDPEWGFSVLPGVVTSPGFLLFGRVGYSRSEFFGTAGERERNLQVRPFDSNGNVIRDGSVPRTTESEIQTNSEELDAFHFGFGAETMVSSRISFRMDYIFTNYDNFFIRDFGQVTGGTYEEGSVEVNPTPEVFMGSLIFNFGGADSVSRRAVNTIKSGPYAGLGIARKTGTIERHRERSGVAVGADVRPWGLAGEEVIVMLGYGQKLFSNFYVGADVSYSPVSTVEFDREFGYNTYAEMEDDFSASSVFGYLVRPDTLIYGKVGYTTTDISYERTRDSGLTFSGIEASNDTELDGVLFGLGLENQISEKMFLRVEYNYMDYDNWSGIFSDSALRENKFHRMALYLGFRLP